jgi:hypothetical protein
MIIEVQLYEDYLSASSFDATVALLGCVLCVVGSVMARVRLLTYSLSYIRCRYVSLFFYLSS